MPNQTNAQKASLSGRSGSPQLTMRRKTRLRITAVQDAVLQELEKVKKKGWTTERRQAVDSQLVKLENLYVRLAWLKLDPRTIAQYMAESRSPEVRRDPVFEAKLAAFKLKHAQRTSSEQDILNRLFDQGLIAPVPHILVYPEAQYYGTPTELYEPRIAEWNQLIPSLKVPSGSAAVLFQEPHFWGSWQVVTTDIPDFYSYSRLAGHEIKPVGSLLIYSLRDLPYSGAWAISAAPGQYLSARMGDVLRVADNVGAWETFRFDPIENLEQNRVKGRLVVDNVTPFYELEPVGAARAGDVFILSERLDLGYRCFTLTDLGGRPVVLGDDGIFRYTNKTKPPTVLTRAIKIAHNESEVGMLQQGEVALYDSVNYWGRVWIFSDSHPNFGAVEGLDEVVSSVRLGPYTGVTLYREAEFGESSPELERCYEQLRQFEKNLRLAREAKLRGEAPAFDWTHYPENLQKLLYNATLDSVIRVLEISVQSTKLEIERLKQAIADRHGADPSLKQDLTEDAPNLASIPIGSDTLSSLRIWSQIAPEMANISYTCSLSEDYRVKPDGNGESILAYRTVLTFVPVVTPQNSSSTSKTVTEAEIWATDASTIEIGGTSYEVDEDRSVKVPVSAYGQLVIISEAREIATPGLKIRTNTMADDVRIILYPDRNTHQRLATLEDDELYNAKTRDGQPLTNPKYTKEQIGSAQKAIQNAMSSIVYADPGVHEVLEGDRFISARAVRDTAWRLDFGVVAAHPVAAASTTPGAPPIAQGAAPMPATGGPRDFQPLDKQAFQARIASLSGNLSTCKVVDFFEDTGEAIADAFEDAAEVIVGSVEWAIEAVGDIAEDTINTIKEFGIQAWETIENFGEKLVAIIVTGFGEVKAFVLDTVDKVVTFATAIIEKIVETIKMIIEYLAFLFDWGDIKATMLDLGKVFSEGITYGRRQIAARRPEIHRRLDSMESFLRQNSTRHIDSLISGLGGDPSRRSQDGGPLVDVFEFLGEVQEKIFWLIDKILTYVPGMSSESLYTVSPELGARLGELAASTPSPAGQMNALTGSLVSEILATELTPQGVLVAVLKMLRAIVDAVIDGVVGLAEGLLDLGDLLLESLGTIMTKGINIPFFSWLFDLVIGEELSMLNLATLILAVPVTLTTKITRSIRPQLPVGYLAQASSTKDVEFSCTVVAECADLIACILSAGLDIIPSLDDGKAPSRAYTIEPRKANRLGEISEGLVLVLSTLSWAMGCLPFGPVSRDNKDDDEYALEWTKWGLETLILGIDYWSTICSSSMGRRSGEKAIAWTTIGLETIHLAIVAAWLGVGVHDQGAWQLADSIPELVKCVPGPLSTMRQIPACKPYLYVLSIADLLTIPACTTAIGHAIDETYGALAN